MSCDCYCPMTLNYGAMCWSAVYECGISRPYAIAFLIRLDSHMSFEDLLNLKSNVCNWQISVNLES